MTTYTWPGFPVLSFEMRIAPNQRQFVGPYTPTVQVLDLLGERWIITITLAPTVRDTITAAALEAFWDRLKGQANSVTLWHIKRPLPQGTMRGSVAATWHVAAGGAAVWHNASSATANWFTGEPVVHATIAQLASTGTIRTLPGKTLLAGDHIGIGGQLVRIMANATADGSGLMPIEFQPRARNSIPAGSVVIYDTPTANFILKPGTLNVPTTWTPDFVNGASVDFIEVY